MKNIIRVSIFSLPIFFIGCNEGIVTKNGISAERATSHLVVKKQANGLTLEQNNIVNSYKIENRLQAVKHLYVISPYNGSVLIYSTVQGKVTSNAKSLTPRQTHNPSTKTITIHGDEYRITQMMNESGTYGESKPNYIYWWDTKGVYHKHFVTGGQMIHISDQPLPVRDIVINLTLKG